MEKCLWEILVPTIHSTTGKPIKLRFHKVWDAKVRAIANGLTILSPVKGQWKSLTGHLFTERMIPVRIACSQEAIEKISDMTAVYYNQLAVMYYRVSDYVVIKEYPK